MTWPVGVGLTSRGPTGVLGLTIMIGRPSRANRVATCSACPAANSRAVLLDFEPAAGYWDLADGISLIHETAAYARQGPITLTLEMPFSTVMPEETPRVRIHLRGGRRELTGEVKVELFSGAAVLETLRAPCSGTAVDMELAFRKAYPPGFYTVRGVWEENGQAREAYYNGLMVEDRKLLTSGPALGAKG